jgi:hypothetical protein
VFTAKLKTTMPTSLLHHFIRVNFVSSSARLSMSGVRLVTMAWRVLGLHKDELASRCRISDKECTSNLGAGRGASIPSTFLLNITDDFEVNVLKIIILHEILYGCETWSFMLRLEEPERF